jgi:drug/metabolite transporter (DMT)-like permease
MNAVVGRALVGHFPPMALAFGRWALAFVILLPFAWRPFLQALPVLRRHLGSTILLSVLGVTLYGGLLYLALLTSTPVNILLIGATAPAFIVLLRSLIDRRRPSARMVSAALLSIGGVIAVGTQGSIQQLGHLRFSQGDLIMLGATLAWVTYTLILQHARPPVPTAPLLLAQIGIGWLFMIPCFLVEQLIVQPTTILDRQSLLSLAYVAVFPSILAYLAWDRGVRAAGADVAMVLANVTPVFAAALSWLFLREGVGAHHLVAAVLIFCSIRLATRAQG